MPKRRNRRSHNSRPQGARSAQFPSNQAAEVTKPSSVTGDCSPTTTSPAKQDMLDTLSPSPSAPITNVESPVHGKAFSSGVIDQTHEDSKASSFSDNPLSLNTPVVAEASPRSKISPLVDASTAFEVPSEDPAVTEALSAVVTRTATEDHTISEAPFDTGSQSTNPSPVFADASDTALPVIEECAAGVTTTADAAGNAGPISVDDPAAAEKLAAGHVLCTAESIFATEAQAVDETAGISISHSVSAAADLLTPTSAEPTATARDFSTLESPSANDGAINAKPLTDAVPTTTEEHSTTSSIPSPCTPRTVVETPIIAQTSSTHDSPSNVADSLPTKLSTTTESSEAAKPSTPTPNLPFSMNLSCSIEALDESDVVVSPNAVLEEIATQTLPRFGSPQSTSPTLNDCRDVDSPVSYVATVDSVELMTSVDETSHRLAVEPKDKCRDDVASDANTGDLLEVGMDKAINRTLAFAIENVSPKEGAVGVGSENVDVGGAATSIDFEWRHTEASKVFVAGCFNDWSQPVPMKLVDGSYVTTVSLPRGTYEFKFIVDGHWWYDILLPNRPDVDGNWNNWMVVS